MEANSRKVDDLAKRLKGRMIITLKQTSWEEAGQRLEYAVLVKRAYGKPFKKKSLIEVLNGVWKVSQKPSFIKVEDNTLLTGQIFI